MQWFIVFCCVLLLFFFQYCNVLVKAILLTLINKIAWLSRNAVELFNLPAFLFFSFFGALFRKPCKKETTLDQQTFLGLFKRFCPQGLLS